MIAVVGASSHPGAALCRTLAAEGQPYIPVVRDPRKWASLGLPGEPRIADLTDPHRLARTLEGADRIVSCVHARYAAAILAASPGAQRYVLLGSTRRFSRWPDAHGEGVKAGEAAFLAAGRPGVMLHPTMIYGAEGEDNVQRLAALLRRLPLAPLPGGGRALVQPIHQDDLTRCILAALRHPWERPETLVVAGPEPLPYRVFLTEVARAAGIRPPRVMPLPGALLMALAPLTRALPFLPRIRAAEVRRLLEDKAFPIGPMRRALGVSPVPLAEGLARTFAPRHT